MNTLISWGLMNMETYVVLVGFQLGFQVGIYEFEKDINDFSRLKLLK